jgi:hypothetical protein
MGLPTGMAEVVRKKTVMLVYLGVALKLANTTGRFGSLRLQVKTTMMGVL